MALQESSLSHTLLHRPKTASLRGFLRGPVTFHKS
jgi:hypothetical protein